MTSGRAASSGSRSSVRAGRASFGCSAGARSNQPVSPGEWLMAMAATMLDIALASDPPLEPLGQLEGLGGLLGERAPVRLQRGMGVRVARGAEEQPHDLGDVVLMDTELVQAPHVPVLQGLRLLGAESKLPLESCEIGPPALAQARVLAHVEDHLVER